MNVASFIVSLLKNITTFGQKLYEAMTYEVNISWLNKVGDFFGASFDLPSSVSIAGLILTIGAIPLAAIIIYSIFKP